MNKLIALFACSFAAFNLATVQAADSADSRLIEEVIVTATYRETNLMETPIAISAVTDDMVEDLGAQSMEDVFTMIPGLNMVAGQNGTNGEARYTVRGITSQSGHIGYAPVGATVGVYLDGTPITAALGPDNQVSGTLFDIDRVEVLKGPQGTLFGEGSQGGTIRYIYKQPDPSGFDAAANAALATMAASDDLSNRLDAMINLPLGSGLALRLAGWRSETAGYIDNLDPAEEDFNTGESIGARAAMRYEGESFSVTGSWFHSEQKTKGGVATFEAYKALTRRIPDAPPVSEDSFDILSLVVEVDFSWATLTSMTSYTDRDITSLVEGEPTGIALLDFFYGGATQAADHPACETAAAVGAALGIPSLCPGWPGLLNFAGPVFTPDGYNIQAISNFGDSYSKRWVQELRLVSPSDQRLRWTLGAFWKDSEDHTQNQQQASYFPGRELFGAVFDTLLTVPANTHTDFLEEWAFFGEASFDLTDTLEITAGVRVSDLEQDFTNTGTGTDDSPVSPKLVLSWQPLDDLLLYASYATGFRPGNVNNNLEFYALQFEAQGLNDLAALSRTGLFFDGDEVDSYELGLKATVLDGRVAVLASGYFLDWKDMIIHEVDPTIGTGDVYNVNSGGAEIKGFELEVNAFVTDRLNIRLAGDYNDSEVTRAAAFSSSPDGNRLVYAPEYTVSAALSYSQPLANDWKLDFYLDRAWVAKQYADAGNTLEIPSYERSNARITLRTPDRKWRAAIYANNLDNNQILRGRTPTGTLFWQKPRQVGIEVGYQL